MNNTITKLLLTGVLSLGTIGTVGVSNENKESNVERKEVTLQEAKEKIKTVVDGNIERVEEEYDEYKNYTKSGDYVYEIEVDKVTKTQQQTAKELGIPDSKIKLIDLILQYYPDLNKTMLAKENNDDLIDILEDAGYDDDDD